MHDVVYVILFVYLSNIELCEAIRDCDIQDKKIMSPTQLVEMCTTKSCAYCRKYLLVTLFTLD